jgi:hypothetical protein
MRRFLLVAMVVSAAICAQAKLRGEVTNGPRLTVEDYTRARCPDFTKADAQAVEEAAGKNYTFLAVEIDNRDGQNTFTFRPWLDDSEAKQRSGASFKAENLDLKVISAKVSNATKALFAITTVAPKERCWVILPISSEASANSIATLEIWEFGELVVRCE